MITPEKMEEWIREIEERPSSALIIVRYIANRLSHLARRNEELLDENIQLRSEKKVEEYEARIANLEYQLDLLKRQLGGEVVTSTPEEPAAETVSILIYDAQGRVLRVELSADRLASRQVIARLKALSVEGAAPRLLATGSHEELLFLFDSGRTETLPVTAIPACGESLDWEQATLEEPRGGEELAAVVPIGRMSLADACIQYSRRGCVKKMMRSAFESFVAKNFVGTGVKLKTDRTAGLTLCGKEDRLVLASREGFLLTAASGNLPYAIEETIRLSSTDHILRGFTLGQKKLVVFLTDGGKVIQREVGWLEPAASLKTHGQSVFSAERRRTGVHLVGAEAVDETDWAAALDGAGNLSVVRMNDLLGDGTLFPGQAGELVSFAVFQSVK